MDREQLIRDIADKFKADGYGWSQALDEAVHLVETVERFGYTITRPEDAEEMQARLRIAERALTVKAPMDTWDGSPESLNYDTGWDDCLRAIWGDYGPRGGQS